MVASDERPFSGCAKAARRHALRCRPSVLRHWRSELRAVPRGLLEVVAEDLVELDEVRRRAARASRRTARAARRASPSAARRRRRRGSAGGGSGTRRRRRACACVGADQLLAHERDQLRSTLRLVGRERLTTAPRWNTWPSTAPRSSTARSARRRAGRAGRRAAPGSSAARVTSAVGRRRAPSRAISSTNSGLPSAASRIRARSAGVELGRRARRSALARLGARSGSSSTVVAFSLPPPQPGRRSSSSGRAMQSSRIGASRERSATCSTRSRKRRLGPVHVVEDARRAAARRRRPRAACGPPRRSPRRGRRLRLAEQRARAAGTSGRAPAARPQLLDDLDDRPVGDALAVGEAAAADDRARRRPARNSAASRDLPTPAAPSTVNSWHERSRDGLVEGVAQPPQLALAADHRRVEPPRDRVSARQREQAVRRDRLRLALQLERLDRLRPRPRRARAHASRADQDLAGLRRLLEPRGDVDGVAGREPLGRAGDHLAGVDADPRLRRRAPAARRASRAPRAPRAARRPRAATGTPKTAITASPMNFSTVPPCALDDRPSSARSSGPAAPRSASGSSRSPSAVEPVTSQKSTVTVLRCSRGGSPRPAAPRSPGRT